MKKLLIALFCVALPLSSMSFVHAQEKKETANTSIKEDVFNDGEYAYGDGFQDIAEANPYARVEGYTYQRNGNYILYNLKTTSLYKEPYGNVKAKLSPKIRYATKRYGNYFYVNTEKGSGWITTWDDNIQELEIEDISAQLKTTKTLDVYSVPIFDDRFETGTIPAGTYTISKRANYFAYVNNGKYKGWILTSYHDDGTVFSKQYATYLNTKRTLSQTSVNGVAIKQKLLPKISDPTRSGISMVPKYVTIHNTANASKGADAAAHANIQYERNVNRTAAWTSWHFQVDNKVIYQSLAMNEVGWHAGDGNDSGNASTIGIEICENADGNYAKAEKNAAYLTASILYENGLPYTAVKRHQDWSGKDCPYNMNHMKKGSMGWTKFKAMVKDEYTKLQLKLSTSSTSLPAGTTMTIKPMVSSKLTNKKVTWSSSNADIASVDANGTVLGIREGSVTITAKDAAGGKASCKVSVKPALLTLHTTSITMYRNKTMALKIVTAIQGTPVWKSSDTSVVSVNADGVLTAKKAGKALVFVTADGKNGIASVTVKDPTIKLNTASVTTYVGKTYTLKATVTPTASISWKSEQPSIAKIDAKGTITALKAGTTKISAIANGVTATCSISVKKPIVTLNKASITLYEKGSVTLKATAYGKSQTVRWSSDNKAVAEVSSSGKITAKKAGTAYISARANDAKKTCKVVVVKPSLSLSKTSVAVNVKGSYTLTASVKGLSSKCVWKTKNSSIATVSSTGKITGKKAGTTTISVTANGITKTCKVSVKTPSLSLSKSKLSIYEKGSTTLTAKVSGASSKATWKSSNTKIASISSSGKLTAKKAGKVTITVSANGLKKTCVVTVKKHTPVSSIKLNTTILTLNKIRSFQLRAYISPSKATYKTVKWSSSNTKVATVTSKGKVYAKKAGTAYISATSSNGKKVRCKVRVY